MKRIFYILFLMLLFSVLLYGCSNDSQNKIDKNELITKTYPESICEEIQYRISVGGLHLDNLREIVEVECLRKTGKSSYVVLKLDNQKFAYICIDENNQCQAVYQFSETFYTRAELENILAPGTYCSEVDAVSPNVMYTGYSFASVLVYPVVEGYIVAMFMYDPPDADDEILKSVKFYKDFDDIPEGGHPSVFEILDVDRKGAGQGTVLCLEDNGDEGSVLPSHQRPPIGPK